MKISLILLSTLVIVISTASESAACHHGLTHPINHPLEKLAPVFAPTVLGTGGVLPQGATSADMKSFLVGMRQCVWQTELFLLPTNCGVRGIKVTGSGLPPFNGGNYSIQIR